MPDIPPYPKRPSSHVSGDIAVEVLKSACPNAWIIHPIASDYGLDLRVESTRENEVRGEEFFVQVKGKQSVLSDGDGLTRVQVAKSTVNYWLGKLHPTMVVLVDVTRRRFWFDWLEYAYRDYPKPASGEGNCDIVLSAESASTNFERDVSAYVRAHFQRLRSDVARVFENTQLTRVLLHTSYLYRCCAQMVIALQGEPPTDKEQAQDLFHLFYLEFGLHDEFLTCVWDDFAQSKDDGSSQMRRLLSARLGEYASLRDKFYIRQQRVGVGEFYFVLVKYSAVMENLLPMLRVLSALEEILLQSLVLGRITFPP